MLEKDPIELQSRLTHMRFDEWLNSDIFHMDWWALLLLFGVAAWLWWLLADKGRFPEIFLFAAITSVMILCLDEIGEEMTLWDYPTDVFPLFPPIAAVNLACLPFLYSLIYQFFRTWKSFILATAVMSLFSCFIFEPIFIWLKMYQMIAWKSWYGLPLYFAIGVLAKALLTLIGKVESKYGTFGRNA